MSVPLSIGYSDLKATGLIPSLFAKEFNVFYWPTTRMSQVTTGIFYEPLLSMGDQITVPNLPIFGVFNVTKGMDLPEPEAPVIAPVVMTVNRAKGFNVTVDDIDAKQSHINIGPKYQKAAYMTLERAVETEFWADIVTHAHAMNQGGGAGKSGNINLGTKAAPIPLNTGVSTKLLIDMFSVLADQSAESSTDLWAIIPNYAAGLLVQSDLKAVYLTGDKVSPLRTGDIGKINDILVSRSVLTTNALGTQADPVPIIVGNKDAISYIAQLNRLRIIDKDPKSFRTLFQGLFVYDWSVRKPEGLVVAWVYYN
jgi:hypothetical protein